MDHRPSTKTTDARNRKLKIRVEAVVPLSTSQSHTSKRQKPKKGRKQVKSNTNVKFVEKFLNVQVS